MSEKLSIGGSYGVRRFFGSGGRLIRIVRFTVKDITLKDRL